MSNLTKYLDIDYLKMLGIPYYFGLGFIQLKFNNGNSRLHFYHPEILPILDDEEIHNHRYEFDSYVVKGFIDHEIFTYKAYSALYDKSKFSLVEVSCKKEDAGKEPKFIRSVKPIRLAKFTTLQDSSYSLTPDAFHRIKIWTPTITFLRRGPIVTDTAQVIRDDSKPAVCPFSKKMSPDECWEVIEKIIK